MPLFRGEFCSCLTTRSDVLCEPADAVLCGDGPVRPLAELSLAGGHRRGHGGLYATLAKSRVDAGRMRRALAAVPLPRSADGRLVLAIDVTCRLRPDAHTSPQRILCHTYGRGKHQHIPVPGRPCSIVRVLEPGRSTWTAPLEALRLAPGDDTAGVTARQLSELLLRLIAAGQWRMDDPDVLVIADAGYDAPRLAFLLKDLPAQALARMRSDRVPHRPAPPRQPHATGRPPRHGGEFVFGRLDTQGRPGHRNRYRHTPLRHRPCTLLGSSPPRAHPPLVLVRGRRHFPRPLAADRHRPREKPAPAERLSLTRVRRDFRHIHPQDTCPARAPKPSRPGPGRPLGRRNTRPTCESLSLSVFLATAGAC
ncbi:transposase [Streptomyces sp. NPDC005009]